jgi:hypothetical protein
VGGVEWGLFELRSGCRQVTHHAPGSYERALFDSVKTGEAAS